MTTANAIKRMNFKNGFLLQEFPVPAEFQDFVENENWVALDSAFKQLTEPGGSFFQFLKTFYDFSSIEFIISIRDSKNDWEEDGIWHDDGSRVFAFSLSLTPELGVRKGGHLEMKQKGREELLASIPTPVYGTTILFLTGIHGFEHRTRAVLEGKRIILAGWCSA
jgi:hypothetical protein